MVRTQLIAKTHSMYAVEDVLRGTLLKFSLISNFNLSFNLKFEFEAWNCEWEKFVRKRMRAPDKNYIFEIRWFFAIRKFYFAHLDCDFCSYNCRVY